MPNSSDNVSVPEHLEGRVTRLEAQLSGIAEDIQSLTGIVGQQSTNISRMQEATAESLRRQGAELTIAIQSVAGRVEAAQRPQWATYASWLAVLLAIGGIFGAIIVRALDQDRSDINSLEARAIESARERGELHERARWIEKLQDEGRRDG